MLVLSRLCTRDVLTLLYVCFYLEQLSTDGLFNTKLEESIEDMDTIVPRFDLDKFRNNSDCAEFAHMFAVVLIHSKKEVASLVRSTINIFERPDMADALAFSIVKLLDNSAKWIKDFNDTQQSKLSKKRGRNKGEGQ